MQIHRIMLDGKLDVRMDGIEPDDEELIDEAIDLIERVTYRRKDAISISIVTGATCVLLNLVSVMCLVDWNSLVIYTSLNNKIVNVAVFFLFGGISYSFLREHFIRENERDSVRLRELVRVSEPCRDLVIASKQHSWFICKNYDYLLVNSNP